jgi:dihydrofolate synthase/folylpolyglutamate synthase
MSQAAIAEEAPSHSAYQHAIDQLYALGQELAPLPPLPDGTPAPRRKWDLAHMRTLCAALGNPQNTFPSVLIAGTNGKGSTAATLASILSAAGYKTGLYTSPHLVRVNERIQILQPESQSPIQDGRHPERSEGSRGTPASPKPLEPFSPNTPGAPSIAPPSLTIQSYATGGNVEIPDPTFARLFTKVEDTAAALVSAGTLPHPPSFFEVLTALAFLYYAEEKVDIAVLEVGLGGRLDATNIVEPLISVITDIALDHQDYLGDTIAAITREKAGILRNNGILVTLPQHPEANQAIGEAAATLNLTAISAADFIPQQTPSSTHHPRAITHPSAVILSEAKDPARAHITSAARTFQPQEPSALPSNHYTLTLENQPLEIDSPLPGHHQQRNIALAIAVAATLRNFSSYNLETSNQKSYNIPNSAIEAGIRNTRWPGRLEFLPPNLLLDVAHNPAGAWTLRAAIAQLPESQPRTLIFSCLADKNLTEISRILFPLFDSSPEGGRQHDHILLAPIANPRAAKVEDLLAAAHALDIPAHASPHLEAALAQARAITPAGGLIIATGSVYLVGAIRDLATATFPPNSVTSPKSVIPSEVEGSAVALSSPTSNSVILSEVSRSASSRETESKDPDAADTADAARTFLPPEARGPHPSQSTGVPGERTCSLGWQSDGWDVNSPKESVSRPTEPTT